MTHSYIAYVDEAGDDGLGHYRAPRAQGGASHWFLVGACVFRMSRNIDCVGWRDALLDGMPKKQRRTIHFANLNHSQKLFVSETISSNPVRLTTVISYKPVIPEDTFNDKNQLYWHRARYLIERLSWLCRDLRPRVPEGNGQVKIIFSRRGGMDYADFRSYMRHLCQIDDQEVRIHWPVIDIASIEARDHSTLAGLQIADCCVSSVASALEPDYYGNVESRYLQNIKPVIYQRNGNYFSYGLKLVPPLSELGLTNDQARALSEFK